MSNFEGFQKITSSTINSLGSLTDKKMMSKFAKREMDVWDLDLLEKFVWENLGNKYLYKKWI